MKRYTLLLLTSIVCANEQDLQKLQQRCDSGDAEGCFNLGLMYDEGKVVPKDNRKAVELYRKACYGDNMAGYNNLGVII